MEETDFMRRSRERNLCGDRCAIPSMKKPEAGIGSEAIGICAEPWGVGTEVIAVGAGESAVRMDSTAVGSEAMESCADATAVCSDEIEVCTDGTKVGSDDSRTCFAEVSPLFCRPSHLFR